MGRLCLSYSLILIAEQSSLLVGKKDKDSNNQPSKIWVCKNNREEIGSDIHPPTAFWLVQDKAIQRKTHPVGSRVQLSLW
jgi:hypothetical protein